MKTLLLSAFTVLSLNAFACHGLALVSPSVTTNATNIVINANSDAASCGCGPYWLQVELSYSGSFTGAPPASASPAWGSFPWYHSLLNVPNYNAANGWPDNCAIEPYTTINIPFSQLCAGSTVYVRYREYVEASASAGPWSAPATVTVPGSPTVLTGSASATNMLLCQNDSTFLSVTHNGCSGNYNVSWAPAANVPNPTGMSTWAYPTTTTTYTVTFTDVGLAQTFTSTVTVVVSPPMTINLTPTIASCNQSDADISSSVVGGIYPYTYLWNNGDTNSTLSNVPIGTYSLVGTDSAGCTSTASVVVTDSCDYVWPGDANDDAVADINDILAIGVANGATGTTRPGATTTWIGQWSQNWGPTLLSGTDYKFVDCNGDGAINPTDTNAVLLNWGMVHNNRLAQPGTSGANTVLIGECIPDTIGGNANGILRVYLGDTVTSWAINFYGISFKVTYDETYIDPSSIGIDASNTWTGAPTNVMAVRKVENGYGQTYVALTRLNQIDTSGYGILLDVYYRTTGAIIGTQSSVQMPFEISDVQMITSAEGLLPVDVTNDTLTVLDSIILGTDVMEINSFSVYPNPAIENITVTLNNRHADQIAVTDLAGRIVVSPMQNVNASVVEIGLGNLAPGVYVVSVENSGIVQRTRIVVE